MTKLEFVNTRLPEGSYEKERLEHQNNKSNKTRRCAYCYNQDSSLGTSFIIEIKSKKLFVAYLHGECKCKVGKFNSNGSQCKRKLIRELEIEEVLNFVSEDNKYFFVEYSKRDALPSLRGYIYQDYMTLKIFLDSIDTDIELIIQEGYIDGKNHEDITIRSISREIVTNQIKYTKDRTCFKSNEGDLFKTLGNKNNINAIVNYIVGYTGVGNPFDETLSNWDTYSKGEKQDKFISLHYDGIRGVTGAEKYVECYDMLMEHPEELISTYLNNFHPIRGPNFNELLNLITHSIRAKFLCTDDIVLFAIGFTIRNMLTENIYSDNPRRPINIKDTANTIRSRFIKQIYTSDDYKLIIDDYINNMINIMQRTNNDDHRRSKIDDIINNIVLNIESIKRSINLPQSAVVANIIHICHKILPSPHINTNIYKELTDIMCRLILRCIDNNKIDEEIDSIGASYSYYTNHKIENYIDLPRSGVQFILLKEDITYLDNIKEKLQQIKY